MIPPLTSDLVGIILIATLAAAAIVLAIELVLRRKARPSQTGEAGQAVFLFQARDLVDATPPARALLRLAGRQGGDLGAIADFLDRRFPGLARRLDTAGTGDGTGGGAGTETIDGRIPGEMLIAERWDGFTRLSLMRGAGDGAEAADLYRLSALEEEVTSLRAIAEDAPQLIWKEDANGAVDWANRAYLHLADRLAGGKGSEISAWPARPVFGDAPRPEGEGGNQRRRVTLTLPGEASPQWFEITHVRRGDHILGFAIDATGAVAAEEARRTTVQTLTKTFAHLRAGLAVFDRQRRLVLFNPAFLDLTGLRVDFLSQRPQVHSVLDRLRDAQMLPEPKNYRSWREQVAALEAAAEQGTYCETWVLPGGQTYRVSGRPHPDGAIAFLFEDISDEVSLTRHFRLEQETVQAVMDQMPQAIAVFSAGGTMTLSNASYDRLWGRAAEGLAHADLAQEIARWKGRSAPAPAWTRIEAGLGSARLTPGADRVVMTEDLRLSDGRRLEARFVPLPGGATLVEFAATLPHAAGAAGIGSVGHELLEETGS